MKIANARIEEIVGHINTDVIAGWEAGLKGRKRVAGLLLDRLAPDHLTGDRLVDWILGHNAARAYLQSLPRKEVHFVGHTREDKEVLIVRKGWHVPRAPIITRMEKMGCLGDVMVYFFEGGDLKKKIRCGI